MDWLHKASAPFRQLSIYTAVALLTFISACGGGGGGGFDGGGSGGGGSTNTRTVTLTISNTNVTAASPATLTATVKNSNGTAVQGVVVTFASSLGVFNPVAATSLTDANGVATIEVLAGNSAGAAVITATLSTGETGSIGFTTAGDAGNSAGKKLVLSSSSTHVTSAAPATISVKVTNNGDPLSGEVVEFTTSSCGTNCFVGSFVPSSGTALTNSEGIATITLTAGSNEGAGVITAKLLSSGESTTLGFTTAGDASAVTGKQVSISSTNTHVTAATPATLTVTVTANGSPAAGEVVEFSTTNCGFNCSVGRFTPSSGTALTNASGIATITLTAGANQGAGIVTAKLLSTGESNTIGFTTAGDEVVSTGKVVALSFSSNTTHVTASTPLTLRATVTNNGSPVAGDVVTFTTTLGAFIPASGTALTDASGVATVTITAGSVEGAGLITARASTGERNTIGFTTAGDASTGSILLELTDSNGVILNPRQISSTNPGKIRATVNGITKPVIVTFTSDLGNIPITTAITDTNNVATVDIFASNSLGAGTITASLVSGETAQIVFSIGASSLGIGTSALNASNQPDGKIQIAAGNLSAGGTKGLAVTVWDTSVTPPVPFTDAVDVNFSSECSNLSTPTAKIDSPVTTVNGVANSTYLAQGCEGDDIVTATANAGGIVLSATGQVTITPAGTGSIEFVSATPQNIVLKGVGGVESSTLIFRVLDTNGNPVSNKLVNFSSNTSVGGLSLSPTSATTNSDGQVQTVVNSGTVHTTVRVTAEVDGSSPAIRTQSSLLVISTGIPDQDSFSLSASVLNPEGWDVDGTEVTITARLADAFNNPVPDGTAVSFTTEGGSIEDSCTTTKGVCSVKWTSANARPEGQVLGAANNGATVILGNVDISNGANFSPLANNISFTVEAAAQKDTVVLNANYPSKTALLAAINNALTSGTVVAGSGPDNRLRFISTNRFTVRITNVPVAGSTTNTLTKLGIPDITQVATATNSSSPSTVEFMGQKYGGRATISATAIGEESFPDTNGNGVFDGSEFSTFIGNGATPGTDVNGQPFDLGESFVDHNEDDLYNPQVSGGMSGGELERFDDFNSDGTFNQPDGKYNGSLCGDTPANCSSQKSVNVRGSLVLVMSGSNPRFLTTAPAGGGIINIKGEGTQPASIIIADLHNQPMPAGTKVEFTPAVGSIVGPSSFVWPNHSRNGGLQFGVTVKGEKDKTESGPLIVTVTTPGGVITTHTVATISIAP